MAITLTNEIRSQEPIQAGETPKLRRLRALLRTSITTTSNLRHEITKDYEYVDSKQWSEADKAKLASRGRPALTFNKILPQVELVCGIQRQNQSDIIAVPRGTEDRSLGDIARGTLRATQDFIRLDATKNRFFDDGMIGGLGALEVLYTDEDVDDLLWGEVVVNRIQPLSFFWDTWAQWPKLQDGDFMAKGDWVTLDEYRRRWPKAKLPPTQGEWLNEYESGPGDAGQFGVPLSLLNELYDPETGRYRILTVWHKEPVNITLVANEQTGAVTEVKNRDEALRLKSELAEQFGRRATENLTIVDADEEIFIADQQGNPLMNPQTGLPAQFVDVQQAEETIGDILDEISLQFKDVLTVIKRKTRKPHWTEMAWWGELDSGETPFNDRNYPFVPYISRQFSDDPSSIQGIVRAIRDAQDEYNKRYSQLLGHLNLSAHSGWLARKGSVNTQKLELMGARPGIVVEYTTSRPEKIEPSNISTGHFTLLGASEANIRTTTGVNAELVGSTTQVTVSGRAIRARQQGGLTILQPRFASYQEALLDLGHLLLSRVQQYYPPEKIRRIIGVTEAKTPLGPEGNSIFEGMSEEEAIRLLLQMKNTKFDLVLQTSPDTATERQAQFEQGVEMAGLLSSVGAIAGPTTIAELIKLADLPQDLAEALSADLAAAAQAPVIPGQEGQGPSQPDQFNKMIQNIRGGRSGGNDSQQT